MVNKVKKRSIIDQISVIIKFAKQIANKRGRKSYCRHSSFFFFFLCAIFLYTIGTYKGLDSSSSFVSFTLYKADIYPVKPLELVQGN